MLPLASRLHIDAFKLQQKELGLLPPEDEADASQDTSKDGAGTRGGEGGARAASEGNVSKVVEAVGVDKCDRLEQVRDFEIETVGFGATGRSCAHCHRYRG